MRQKTQVFPYEGLPQSLAIIKDAHAHPRAFCWHCDMSALNINSGLLRARSTCCRESRKKNIVRARSRLNARKAFHPAIIGGANIYAGFTGAKGPGLC